jgi:hypothetical protein
MGESFFPKILFRLNEPSVVETTVAICEVNGSPKVLHWRFGDPVFTDQLLRRNSYEKLNVPSHTSN